jgi:hypothetical protein
MRHDIGIRISQKGHGGRLNRHPWREAAHMAGPFALISPPSAYPSPQISNGLYLGHFESYTPGGLPIGDGKIGRETGVSDYGRQCIPVLVCQPLAVMDE